MTLPKTTSKNVWAGEMLQIKGQVITLPELYSSHYFFVKVEDVDNFAY
jgi:hypothetical protein